RLYRNRSDQPFGRFDHNYRDDVEANSAWVEGDLLTVGAVYDRGLEIVAVIQSVNELESSIFPSLHQRKEGRAASSIKFCEATEADAAGVVFRPPPRVCFQSENHPVLASAVASRFLLIARPPLLALVQGGEYYVPTIHSHLHKTLQ